MDLEYQIRSLLLQQDISLSSENLKNKVVAITAALKGAEREYPGLEKFLTTEILQQIVQAPDPKTELHTSFKQNYDYLRENSELIQKLEQILTIDGQGRPRKATLLLEIISNTDPEKLRQEIAKISQRRFF